MNTYAKIVIWVFFLYCSKRYGFSEIYAITSGILFIFFNLGERKGPSAYSVFNKDCAKLAGEFDPENITNQKSTQNKLIGAQVTVKNQRLANKPCPCGSGKKHKKCCLHAKDSEDF